LKGGRGKGNFIPFTPADYCVLVACLIMFFELTGVALLLQDSTKIATMV